MWDRCWSQAQILLGLSADEFFRLTPRQFHLLIDRHRERTEHLELLAGIIASEVANRSMRHPKNWAAPADFMPSRAGQQEPVKRKRPNQKELAVKFRSVFTGLMAQQHGV